MGEAGRGDAEGATGERRLIGAVRPPSAWRRLWVACVVVLLIVNGLGGVGRSLAHLDTALVLACVGAVLLALPRDRAAWASFALALVARWETYTPRVQIHAGKAYNELDAGVMIATRDLRYGEGWPALVGLAWRATGGDLDVVHHLHVLVSALTVPLLVGVVALVSRDRWAPWAAGLIAALLPASLAVAPTENRYVTVAMLQVAAVLGLLRGDRLGLWLAALAAGTVGDTRPEQLAFAGVIGAALLWRRAWAPAALLLVVGLLRVSDLATFAQEGGTLGGYQAGIWLLPDTWVGFWTAQSPALLLDPQWTPRVLLALAGLGLIGGTRRGRRAGLLLVALAVIDTMAFIQLPRPDLSRFQVAAWPWLAASAGLGVSWIASRSRALGLVALIAAVAACVRAPDPFDPPWAWQQEHMLLRESLHDVPAGAVVTVGAGWTDRGHPCAWASRRSPGLWRVSTGPTDLGDYRWVGDNDLAPDAPPVPWDRLTPVRAATFPPHRGGLTDRPDVPVKAGLYRVRPPGLDSGAGRP